MRLSAFASGPRLLVRYKSLRQRLHEIDEKLENIKDSIEKGLPFDVISDRLNALQGEKKVIERELKAVPKKASKKVPNVDAKEVKKLLDEFENSFEKTTLLKQKELIRAFVNRIEIDQITRKATCYLNKLPLPVKVYKCRRPDSNRHDVAIGGF